MRAGSIELELEKVCPWVGRWILLYTMETDMVVEIIAGQCALFLALFANEKIQQKPTLFLPSNHIMNLLTTYSFPDLWIL